MHYAWIIAFTGTLVLLLAQGFGRMSHSVILPPMKEGLSLSYTQVGLIGTASAEGTVPCSPISPSLSLTSSSLSGEAPPRSISPP